jgi:hypothetical protein
MHNFIRILRAPWRWHSCSTETCRSKINILNIRFILKMYFIDLSFIITVHSYKWIHLPNPDNFVCSLQSNAMHQDRQYRLFSHTYTISSPVSWVVTLPSALVKPKSKLTEQDITQLKWKYHSDVYSTEDTVTLAPTASQMTWTTQNAQSRPTTHTVNLTYLQPTGLQGVPGIPIPHVTNDSSPLYIFMLFFWNYTTTDGRDKQILSPVHGHNGTKAVPAAW